VPLTVYPFILRGVTLAGIDSAQCPRKERLEIWHRLASSWRVNGLDQMTRTIKLSEVPGTVEEMLAGKTFGRILVRPEV
jgi:NADPH:quinone reductase-like Zn-dependent oxidoreductase